ncbi:Trehalase [Citrus sinensis]|uniref:Trehalase n=1 Tax=Citrus sinensis TaxID=2711 RepID=A0ACB8LNW0_CITSI|nr:Trehalase [Citrus sinensis]
MYMASFHSRSSNSNGNHPASSFSLLLLFLLLASASVSASETVPKAMSQPATGNFDGGPVVPTTPLVTFLERVQEIALATFGKKDFDPKLYVDLSLKSGLSTTVTAFHKLPRNASESVSAPDFKEFLHEYFDGAGDDLVYAEPPDFVPEPDGFLPKVKNPQVRAWALEVHALWKNLSRRVSGSVLDRLEFHTLLLLPGPIVIPSSRFREVYYWDSYWVIRLKFFMGVIKHACMGLLASKMYKTAKAIVTNLIYLIDTYGYVFNGARAYYTNRSQPPILSAMVYDIYNRTGDFDFVKKALPALLKEHQFWNSRIHKVNVQDDQGGNHTLSRYYAMWNKPRPESSTIDKAHSSKLLNASDKENTSDFTTLAITSILPIDLNIFILKMELDIASMAQIVGDNRTAESFLKTAQARKQAINSVFWNEEKGQWLDYWISNGTSSQECRRWKASNQNNNAFASNFVPIWIDLFNSDTCIVEKVRKGFQSSGLLGAAGIATSLTRSGEQWWINSNYVAYKETGAMHEKYDVEKCRDIGGGGEYIPQTGFSWSNGAVLAFLEEFGWPEDLKIGCNWVMHCGDEL